MSTMRALVLSGPGVSGIEDVEVPTAGPDDAVVTIHRVGVCGTDLELASGEMAYLESGRTTYPVRPGHEWCGVVRSVGDSVDPSWIGRRVAGDTMLSCGRCDRCRSGRRHVCRSLIEVGISGGFAGAVAEQVRVPADSLHALPETVDDAAGAMVEPGGNAWRAAAAAHAAPGMRMLVWGAGTIGLLAAAFAAAAGAEVHLVARGAAGRDLATAFGVSRTWTPEQLPDVPIHAVIDATDDPEVPGSAIQMVEPGGRVVCIGLAGSPSRFDTRNLVLRDITVVGILGGSPGLDHAIEHYADGRVDPRPLIGKTVGLADAPRVCDGSIRGRGGPKVHIDPRR